MSGERALEHNTKVCTTLPAKQMKRKSHEKLVAPCMKENFIFAFAASDGQSAHR